MSTFFDDRIDGIIHNIEKNLLQLVKISCGDGKVGFKLPVDPNAVELHVVFSKDERVFENLIQVHRFSFRFVLARKAEQALHDVMRALRLFVQFFDIVRATRVGEFFGLQKLAVPENRSKRIIELVSNAGDELANRRHLLALQKLFLG